MKNKLITLILAVLCALTLSSCVRMNIEVTVHEDGTADLSLLYAVSSMLGDEYSLGDQITEYVEDGWTAEEYEDAEAGYSGYVLSKKGFSLSELGSGNEEGTLLGLGGENALTQDGNTYILDMPINESEDAQGIMEYGSSIKSYGGSMTVTVNLPIKPEEHNATSVSEDGKSLTWDLLEMNKEDHIYMKVIVPDTKNNILLGAGIGVGILALAGIGFAVMKKKKK